VDNKVYDTTTTATLSGGTLQGVLDGDTVTLTQAGSFANKNVGTGKVVTAANTLGGTDAGNYELTQPTSLSADIAAKSVTVTGTTVANKTYDGTTTATLSGGTLQGLLDGDTVTLTQAGSFANKNVGATKTVTASNTLGGDDADNYALTQPTGLSASVAARTLTISGTAVANKTYDGTTTANVTAGTLSGLAGSDAAPTVTAVGTFANANVGKGKAVTVSYALSDPNYSLTNELYLVDITPDPQMNRAVTIVQRTTSLDAHNEVGGALNASPVMPSAQAGGSNSVVGSTPRAQESTALVTLGQAKAMLGEAGGGKPAAGEGAGAGGDVSVPISPDSRAKIVNGGVKLPEGVDQLLFVIKN